METPNFNPFPSPFLIKAVAPFHVDRKGYHLTLDLVPAWMCQQCGEVYFGEPEVDSIQEIIKTLEDRTEKIYFCGITVVTACLNVLPPTQKI